MKLNKIDHICIAVKDLEAAKKVWEPMLGKSGPDDAYVDELEKIKVARYLVGEVGFELMESTARTEMWQSLLIERVRELCLSVLMWTTRERPLMN